MYLWPSFFLGMGGQWFTSNKLSVNTPIGIESLKYYSDILNNHSISGGTAYNWDQVQLNIQQGKVAMADGATPFAVFRWITMPLLSPILSVAVVFRSMDLFKWI
jgi:hypothetical protein